MGNDYDKKKHEEAYGKGVKDAQKSGIMEDLAHTIAGILPIPSSDEWKSYDAGWNDSKSGDAKTKK